MIQALGAIAKGAKAVGKVKKVVDTVGKVKGKLDDLKGDKSPPTFEKNNNIVTMQPPTFGKSYNDSASYLSRLNRSKSF